MTRKTIHAIIINIHPLAIKNYILFTLKKPDKEKAKDFSLSGFFCCYNRTEKV